MGTESSPDLMGTSESFSLDTDSSPVISTVQPKMQKMQPKPVAQGYSYSQFEVEEKKVSMDPTLFSSHPMHQCPNICEYLKDCMLHCERMMNVLAYQPDCTQRRRQIALLQDCSEVCFLTIRLIARKSPIMKTAILYCAKVCRLCGHECMRYPDATSQACARMCLHCATMCEQFTQGYNWG